MKRVKSIRDIVTKKYDIFPFEGKWKEAFSNPECYGVWFVWGNSGNGKTSFVMQLCKELCKYDRVLFVSLEEGTSLTVKNSLLRFGMMSANGKMGFVKESIQELSARLRQHKSFNIVVVDSIQYSQINYKEYIRFKESFPNKLIIFISHAVGKMPKGKTANDVMFDADLKIWVQGYVAYSKGRYIGSTGRYVIWEDGAREAGMI